MCFVQPLKKFLEGEMRTIAKERAVLESKRLDLDASKNRAKKARSMLGQQAVSSETVQVLIEIKLVFSFARPSIPRVRFRNVERWDVAGTGP